MNRRASPREIIRDEAPAHLGFLVLEGQFDGPELTADGVAYHRLDLRIEMSYWGGREPGVGTMVSDPRNSADERAAPLPCLYAACGYGVAHDLPHTVTNQRTTRLRVEEQARALRRILPDLLGDRGSELLRRCRGRDYPDDRPRPRRKAFSRT
jgi:hypothetical protein